MDCRERVLTALNLEEPEKIEQKYNLFYNKNHKFHIMEFI